MDDIRIVKGLDYELLRKVRAELEAKEREKAQEESKTAKPAQRVEEAAVTEEEEEIDERYVRPRTAAGRALAESIYATLFDKKKKVTSTSNFLPGRMSYIFDLKSKVDAQPTTIVRSRDEQAKGRELLSDNLDPSLFRELEEIMTCVRDGTLKARRTQLKTKKEVQEKEFSATEEGKSVKPVPMVIDKEDSDDDKIFPDVESAVPVASVPATPKAEKPQSDSKPSTYFTNSKIQSLEDVMKQTERLNAMVKQQQESLSKSEEREAKKVREQRLQKIKAEIEKQGQPNLEEEYAECYPGTYEMSIEVQGSDEEADVSKMDMGTKKKNRLRPWDFDSEEAWSSYNDKKEAMPKAAFQFGLKKKEGRKTGKTKKQHEAKIDRDLKKINEIIKKKENVSSSSVPTAEEVRKRMKTS
jgi:IK cytokine